MNAVDLTLHYCMYKYMTYPNPVPKPNTIYESSPTILGKKNIAPQM